MNQRTALSTVSPSWRGTVLFRRPRIGSASLRFPQVPEVARVRVRVQLQAALGSGEEARQSALKALKAAERDRSGYAKHPKVGLVATDDLTLALLRRIAAV